MGRYCSATMVELMVGGFHAQTWKRWIFTMYYEKMLKKTFFYMFSSASCANYSENQIGLLAKIASTFIIWKTERSTVPIKSTEKWRIIMKLQSIMIVFEKSKDHPNLIIILFWERSWIPLTKLLRTWPSYWRWNAKYFGNYLKTLKYILFQLLKASFVSFTGKYHAYLKNSRYLHIKFGNYDIWYNTKRTERWELFILDWCNHLNSVFMAMLGKSITCHAICIAENDTINNPIAHSVLHLISNQNCFAWRMSFAVSTCEIRCGSHAYTWSLLLVFKPRSNPQQPFTRRIFNYLHFKSHLSVFAVSMHKRFKSHLAKQKKTILQYIQTHVLITTKLVITNKRI